MNVGRFVRVILAAAIASLALASPARADLITLDPVAGLDDLFGGSSPAAMDSVRVTPVTAATFQADVYSRVYTDGSRYAYLYQIDNHAVSSDPIELFTVSPFRGATGVTRMGYLTASVPDGFLAGVDQASESTGNVNVSTSAGPIVSFYFSDRYGYSIAPGEQSAVLYVMSDLPPDEAFGNLIDGSVGAGLVAAPVPEPATIGLLALGGAASLAASVRRRRSGRGRG
ncbi:MAG: PEP-CTERM sorting domain-containing protein [Phycisphaerae bacterium]|nr:PEP-CTERM sorting domain-containing protein [Phycisphaerae bacterium]